MRLFNVELYKIRGIMLVNAVESDGDEVVGAGVGDEVADNEPPELWVKYLVSTYTEDGDLWSESDYYLESDMSQVERDAFGHLHYRNNAEEVLEEIKADHPPEKYENYLW